ncbi:MAG: hypothetical protein OXF86_02390 [Caldilineaceae bacterium]|nr:hypothetical protein [Caldilineaceae bacterium]
MYDATLGSLTRVNVRKRWADEERIFTPWLSKNLDQLYPVLGLDLEFLEREKKAGPFKADIFARVTQEGKHAVIENQLESADLRHLGQMLTYVAQLETRYGVWIATNFRGTILRALRTLNAHWPDLTGFFAIKISLFRSSDGTFLPVFDVVDKPNGWEDPIARDFWTYFHCRYPMSSGPNLDEGSSMRRNRILVEEANLRITQYLGGGFVRTYVAGNANEPSEKVLARIEPYREALIKEVRKSELIGGKNRHCTTEFQVNSRDRHNWSEMVDWLESQRKTYERVLRRAFSGGQ